MNPMDFIKEIEGLWKGTHTLIEDNKPYSFGNLKDQQKINDQTKPM